MSGALTGGRARGRPEGKDSMEKLLRRLNELNPDLDILPVEDRSFLRYGRVCQSCPCEKLLQAMDVGIEAADGGLRSGREVPAESACPEEASVIAREVFGDAADLRLGWTYGRNARLTALEYHKCPEAMVAGSDLLLLLGLVCEISWPAGTFDLSCIRAFLVQRGTVLEIAPWCLHGAPVHVRKEIGMRCTEILPRGAREPVTPSEERGGERRLMVGRNTYLIAHPADVSMGGPRVHFGLIGRAMELVTL
jgi:hypothetical protein